MRKRNLTVNTVLAVALGACAWSLPAQDDGVHWLGNYRQALDEAKRTGKPIFLEYRCEP